MSTSTTILANASEGVSMGITNEKTAFAEKFDKKPFLTGTSMLKRPFTYVPAKQYVSSNMNGEAKAQDQNKDSFGSDAEDHDCALDRVCTSERLCSTSTNLSRSIFDTTGLVYSPSKHSIFQVSSIGIDSGAGAVFIHRRVVDYGDHLTQQCAKAEFRVADGRLVAFYETVTIELAIAGVVNRITGYVDDSRGSHNILFGVPGILKYRMNISTRATRSSAGLSVTVAQNLKGMRRERHVVWRDRRGTKNVLVEHRYQYPLLEMRFVRLTGLQQQMLDRLPPRR